MNVIVRHPQRWRWYSMMNMLRQRWHQPEGGMEQADEAGFTLIELMVVVLIIAILAAVAIPTFLGARSRAQHSAAVQNLVNALTAAQTVYTTDNSSYDAGQTCTVTAAEAAGGLSDNTFGCELAKAEPSLRFFEGATPKGDPNSVSLGVGTGNNVTGTIQSIMMSAYDESGHCVTAVEIGSSVSTAIYKSPATPDSAGTWYAPISSWKSGAGSCNVTASSSSTGQDSSYGNVSGRANWTRTVPAS